MILAQVTTLVWDQARGHQGTAFADIPIKRLALLPYSPELNPVERVFEYLRDRIEGIVYGMIAAKKKVVEMEL